MPDIYTYTDYRLFLKDYYGERKKQQPSFSYQYFANRAGLKSKTFIYKVIAGQKALSKGAVFAVSQAMGLKKRETEYFEAMVNFTQARTEREREFYFNHLQTFGRHHSAAQIRQDQYTYFSKWYYPALRELVAILDFKNDFKLLARSLDPPITAVQARKAVQMLLDLGLIKRTASGRYCQTDKSLTTGDHVQSLAVQAFQKENLRLAAEAIDRHKRYDRDISTLTTSISEAGFRRISEEIAAFRKKLAGIIEKDEPADRVYQINFQAFPLSTLPKNG
ncbi:MAG: TIGR02147 family protein [Chitinispirillaceae bacterium]|jgi:uncharacterized protein (TIGR02147 family)